MDGLLVVDKEPGWTSHDVVAKCRGIFGQRKVGHAGTLDPDATGVLLVGLGKATRLLRYIGAGDKRYEGEIALGSTTTTLDASGDTVETFDMSAVGFEDVVEAAATLTGEIEQIPPMVSARRVDGVRLHTLARQGLEVERPSTRVEVKRFTVAPVSDSASDEILVGFEVVCSGGTYVRALADDLGRLLGGGAHLRRLRRTAIGTFSTHEARVLGVAESDHVLSIADALRDMEHCVVGPELAREVSYGRKIELSRLGTPSNGPWAIVAGDGRALAVYEGGDGFASASVVLEPMG